MTSPDSVRVRLPVGVINLQRRPDRRARMAELLAAFPSFDVTFIDAVDGQEEAFRHETAEIRARTGLSWGEIACYHSHLRAWEWAAGLDSPWALILEDDVSLTENAAEVLAELVALDPDADVVRVGADANLIGLPITRLQSGAHLFMAVKNPSLCTGNFIRTGRALALADSLREIHCAIDVCLDRYWFWNLKVLSLAPLLVITRLEIRSDLAQETRQNPRHIVDREIQKIFSRRLRYRRVFGLYWKNKTLGRSAIPTIRRFPMTWKAD